MDYSKYTIGELLDVSICIDKEQFPENHEMLIRELEARKTEIESFKSRQYKDYKFTVESRVKLLSWLQIFTCLGYLYVFVNFLLDGGDAIGLLVYALVALFNGLAGGLTVEEKKIRNGTFFY